MSLQQGSTMVPCDPFIISLVLGINYPRGKKYFSARALLLGTTSQMAL